jgi:CheY-like chemotaxis protein
MARIRLVHSKTEEAVALADILRAAGHRVDYTEKVDATALRALREAPPDAFVIDLSRLPSHGREVAIFLRGQAATRHVPIVFVAGAPEKVEAVRKLLPDAVYTSVPRLHTAVRTALANRPASPVTPPQMMERYRSRSAAHKLGIEEGSTVAVIDPPRDYVSAIGQLPAGASFDESPARVCPVTLWFVRDAESYLAGLPRMRKLAERSKLWVLWPKQASGKGSGITQQFLRESANAVGLVDYKICSVNAVWSGMLFARRR